MKKGPFFTEIRKLDKPEIIISDDMNLEDILGPYEERKIGLVSREFLSGEIKYGRAYCEGKLYIHNTEDDEGNPAVEYYVEQTNGLLVSIDLGDGIFFKNLPTRPYSWSPRDN
jgi:hypothetical protein